MNYHTKKRCCWLWIDLEMTGLNPDHNTILEIAAIATDPSLHYSVEGPSLIINQSRETINNISEEVAMLFKKNNLLKDALQSTISLQDAEDQILEFITNNCTETFYLAGNSIYVDRSFIKRFMPRLDKAAHYRMIDVSTIKLIVGEWFANNQASEFTKKKNHRALDDIKESIQELAHYRQHFFIA